VPSRPTDRGGRAPYGARRAVRGSYVHLLERHVDRGKPDAAHRGDGVVDSRLHVAGDLRQHEAETGRERELEPVAVERDLARPPHTDSVDALGGADDEPCEGAVAELDSGREVHSATASSSADSSHDVEYSPLRNASLATISCAASRVVGTPSSSSSPSARRARSIAAGRVSSQT